MKCLRTMEVTLMKKALFCIIFLVFTTSIFSLDLPDTVWGPEKGGFGFYLRLKKDNKFEFIYSGEGGGQSVLGTYKQDGNNLTLTTVTINEWGELPAYIKQRTIKCKIEDSNSLFSKYKITGNGGLELWCMTHKPNEGEKCVIDGKTVFANTTEGIITDNARMREGPGIQYKYYQFNYYDEYNNNNYQNVVPKGYKIKIFGRSENKTEIDGKEEYWYYCTFRINMREEKHGWIWGGLIDIKKDNSQFQK